MTSAFVHQLLRDLVLELDYLASPLLAAGRSQIGLYRFLATLGWDLEHLLGADLARLTAELGQIQAELARVAVALSHDDDAAMVAEAHARFRSAIDRIEGLYPVIRGLDPADALALADADIASELAHDIAEYLLLLYLARRVPLAFQLGLLFGLIVKRRPRPLYRGGDPGQAIVRYSTERAELNWSGLLSPAANPFLTFLERVEWRRVRSFDDLLRELGVATAAQLGAMQQALGERGLDGMAIHLDHAGLSFVGGNWLPFPDPGAPPITIELPEHFAPRLAIDEQRWRFSWLGEAPTDEASYVLFRERWVEVTLLGAQASATDDSAMRLPGFYLFEHAGQLAIEVVGGMGIRFPLDVLSDAGGDYVRGQALGRFTMALGGQPRLWVDSLAITGDLHLGGSGGIVFHNATIAIGALELPLAATDGLPFDIVLQGEMALPGGSRVAMRAAYEEETILLESTGVVHLGDGIWLTPGDDRPVLFARAALGHSVEFAVSGLFRLPHAGEPGGTRAVAINGTLRMELAGTHWRVAHFEAATELTGLDWTLPGEFRLRDVRARLTCSNGVCAAWLGGTLMLAGGSAAIDVGLIFDDVSNPTRIRIDALVALDDLSLGDLVYLLNAQARLQLETRLATGAVAASGRLLLLDATAGLFPLVSFGAYRPVAEDFQLAAAGLAGEVACDPDGLTMNWTAGRLLLPPVFSAGAGRAEVAISPALPISVRAAGAIVSFDGEVIVSNLGVSFEALTGGAFGAWLDTARLRFSDANLPQFAGASGTITLPLPDGRQAVVTFGDLAWDLAGLPTGGIALAEDLVAFEAGDLRLILVSGSDAGGALTGLTVMRSGAATRFQFDSRVHLVLPAGLLTGADGDTARLEAGGQFVVTTAGTQPSLTVDHLAAAGTFHLGGPDGLLIEDAAIVAEGIDNIFRPTPSNPFVLALSGELVLPAGPHGGLNNARFIFEGEEWPRFDLDGVSGGTGTMQVADGYLPLSISDLRLRFDPDLALPEKLYPQHVTAIVDAEVNIQNVITGAVNDFVIAFDADGTPRPRVDGLLLQVSGLELVEGFSLGGGIAIGGLTNIPNALVLAGRLGGKLNGAGVEALVAFGVVEGIFAPLGAALEANLGPAGIPLWATGFLLTGAAGGIAFTGDNADPDDLRAYVQIDETGAVTSQPRPPAEDAPDTDAQSSTAPAAPPPPGETLAFPCPQEPCPPPSVGMLYQPHPDQAHYPHRVIFKFSALDQATVDGFLEESGISRTALRAMTPDALGDQLSGTVVAALGRSLPFAHEQLALLRPPLDAMFTAAAARALGDGSNVYAALVAAAYKGVHAPNVTLKLTGTVSYTGISAFLSVTGGVVISPTVQSAGVVGSINLVGIPVGTLRGFLTLNNAAGLIDPALCGDVRLALGPLEFGTLRLTFRAGFDFTSCAADVLDLAGALGADLTGPALAVVDRELYMAKGSDIAATLAALAPDQVLAFVALLMQQPPRVDLQQFLVALFDRMWAAFDPQLLCCGSVQPKLFGLPLDGELVGVSATATKDAFAASFRFSPSGLFSRVFYGILPAFDKMSLALRLGLPDPRPLIAAGIGADFNDPPRVLAHARAGLAHALRATVATITYEIAPLGLRLADAQARLILPDLLNHPARPGSPWVRPEQRPGKLPSRMEVLLAALRAGVLGNVFWHGSAAELRALPGLRNGAAIGDLSLREGYFPHGGILGAGHLALPRFFVQAPPLAEYARLVGGQPLEKLQAAQALLAGLTTTEQVGELAFYVPAPNPPTAAFGTAGTLEELLAALDRRTLSLDDLDVGETYSLQESFVRGALGAPDRRVSILGIPVGFAALELVPPDTGREGSLRARAGIPAGSWLRDLVGAATLELSIRQAPPEPVEAHFARLAALLRTPRADTNAVVQRLARDLESHLPKIAIEAAVEHLRLPPALSRVLGVGVGFSGRLYAYSLRYAYDPAFRDPDPVAAARNVGGLVLRLSDLSFKAGPFSGRVPEATFVLGAPAPGPGMLPSLSANIHLGRVAVPGLTLESARLLLGTAPPVAELIGETAALVMGAFRVEPLPSSRALTVRVDAANGTMRAGPARLVVPALGPRTVVRVHGRTPDEPFGFSIDGSWAASLSIEEFAADNPFDPSGLPLFTLPGVVRVALRGDGIHTAESSIDIEADGAASLNLLPGLPIRRRGRASLVVRSDGSFTYAGLHTITLPQFIASGALAVSYTPPVAQRPASVIARLNDATVQIGSLPVFTASLELSPGQIWAFTDLGGNYLGAPGLVEARAGEWELFCPIGPGAITATARRALDARLLGKPIGGVTSLALAIDNHHGQIDLLVTGKAWVPLMPALLEVLPQRAHLRLHGAGAALELAASIRALGHSAGAWHVSRPLDVSIPPGPFAITLLAGSEVAFLPATGPVYRRAGTQNPTRLLFSRDAAGTLGLKLDDVGINLAGEHRVSAALTAGGQADFSWQGTITNNGLSYTPDTLFSIRLEVLRAVPELAITLPKGRLRATFSGWPAGGYPFPEQAVTMAWPPQATGRATPGARMWRAVPGFPAAEYRVTTPELRMQIEGATLRASLVGTVAIRTTERRPDGQPWASVEVTFDVPISATGMLVLPMPVWPALGDPLAGARASCRQAAQAANRLPPFPTRPQAPTPPNRPRPDAWSTNVQLRLAWAAYDTALADYNARLVANNTARSLYDEALKALNAALERCDQANPRPPALPVLPSLSIHMSDLVE